MSVSQVARKYGIVPSQLFYWRRTMEEGALAGIRTQEELVPKSLVKDLERQIRELERMLGKKSFEVRHESSSGKKTLIASAVASTRKFSIRAVAEMFKVSRSNLTIKIKNSSSSRKKSYNKSSDEELLSLIGEVLKERPAYGYRRVTALLNSKLKKVESSLVNHKRVYRIMKQNELLLQKQPRKPKRSHTGKVETLLSNTRWCSDGFNIQCKNGDRVHVAFSIDTCDREVMSYIASTIGIDGQAIRDLMLETIEYRFGQPKAPRAFNG